MSIDSVLTRVFPGRRAQLKREVLAAALTCFNRDGIEATTIDAIRSLCDTSVGAIYHHFGNKEGLVAALFFVAQDDYAQQMQDRLQRADTAQAGVRTIVESYVDWIVAEPDLARFQFQARSVVAKGPHAPELSERNRQMNKVILGWFSPPERKAALIHCPIDLLFSLVLGPAESYCRAWLSGRVKASPIQHKSALAVAAWGAIEALRSTAI